MGRVVDKATPGPDRRPERVRQTGKHGAGIQGPEIKKERLGGTCGLMPASVR